MTCYNKIAQHNPTIGTNCLYNPTIGTNCLYNPTIGTNCLYNPTIGTNCLYNHTIGTNSTQPYHWYEFNTTLPLIRIAYTIVNLQQYCRCKSRLKLITNENHEFRLQALAAASRRIQRGLGHGWFSKLLLIRF